MNRDTKHNIIIFIISILILAGIAYGVYHFIIGRDGVVEKINSVESGFDKTEVLETLTELVKEKYMAVYNESKSKSEVKLEDAYNSDVAISYLSEKGVIDYYYYSNYNQDNNQYTYIWNEKISGETR